MDASYKKIQLLGNATCKVSHSLLSKVPRIDAKGASRPKQNIRNEQPVQKKVPKDKNYIDLSNEIHY